MAVSRLRLYQAAMFSLTFLVYMSCHSIRKPLSIVKNTLHPPTSSAYNASNPGWAPFNQDVDPVVVSQYGYVVSSAGYAPVNGLYKCEHFTDDSTCTMYVNPTGVRLRRSTIEGMCWVFQRRTEDILEQFYYQSTTVGPCAALPFSSRSYEGSESLWRMVEGSEARIPIPFVEPNVINGRVLLGILDTVYLGVYSVCFFMSGAVGDKVQIRSFLTFALAASGVFSILIGLAEPLGIHAFAYYVVMFSLLGVVQSLCFPVILKVLSHWFNKKGRGAILGLWNSCTSLGNVFSALTSVALLTTNATDTNWPAAFYFQGAFIIFWATLVALTLVVAPVDVGLSLPREDEDRSERQRAHSGEESPRSEEEGRVREEGQAVELRGRPVSGRSSHAGETNPTVPLHDDYPDALTESSTQRVLGTETGARPTSREDNDEGQGEIFMFESTATSALDEGPVVVRAETRSWWRRVVESDFVTALTIPGVVTFALCMFFTKLVFYTFLYWLPLYLVSLGYTTVQAGLLSVVQDVGGVSGGIIAGLMSDRIGSYSIVAFAFLIFNAPLLLFYRVYTLASGTSGLGLTVAIMFLTGVCINGPYTLISMVVTSDLGSSLKGQRKALVATVSGIIDGSGSIGAAIQGVVIGSISTFSWSLVFYLLIICCLASALLLSRLAYKDYRRVRLTDKVRRIEHAADAIEDAARSLEDAAD